MNRMQAVEFWTGGSLTPLWISYMYKALSSHGQLTCHWPLRVFKATNAQRGFATALLYKAMLEFLCGFPSKYDPGSALLNFWDLISGYFKAPFPTSRHSHQGQSNNVHSSNQSDPWLIFKMTWKGRKQVFKWGNPMWIGYGNSSGIEVLPLLQSLNLLLGETYFMPSVGSGSLSACSDGSHSGWETSLRKLLAFFSYAVGCAQWSSALIWSKVMFVHWHLHVCPSGSSRREMQTPSWEVTRKSSCRHCCVGTLAFFQYPGEVTFGMCSSYSKDSVTI